MGKCTLACNNDNAILCMGVHVPTVDGNVFVHIHVQVHE